MARSCSEVRFAFPRIVLPCRTWLQSSQRFAGGRILFSLLLLLGMLLGRFTLRSLQSGKGCQRRGTLRCCLALPFPLFTGRWHLPRPFTGRRHLPLPFPRIVLVFCHARLFNSSGPALLGLRTSHVFACQGYGESQTPSSASRPVTMLLFPNSSMCHDLHAIHCPYVAPMDQTQDITHPCRKNTLISITPVNGPLWQLLIMP